MGPLFQARLMPLPLLPLLLHLLLLPQLQKLQLLPSHRQRWRLRQWDPLQQSRSYVPAMVVSHSPDSAPATTLSVLPASLIPCRAQSPTFSTRSRSSASPLKALLALTPPLLLPPLLLPQLLLRRHRQQILLPRSP